MKMTVTQFLHDLTFQVMNPGRTRQGDAASVRMRRTVRTRLMRKELWGTQREKTSPCQPPRPGRQEVSTQRQEVRTGGHGWIQGREGWGPIRQGLSQASRCLRGNPPSCTKLQSDLKDSNCKIEQLVVSLFWLDPIQTERLWLRLHHDTGNSLVYTCVMQHSTSIIFNYF